MKILVMILNQFWGMFSEMAPYLLFGFFLAGILSVFLSPKFVERHLGGRGIWPVIKASLLGVPLPLCSCSVIPVAASLRRHGASKGATVAFLLSTPQTGVDSIMATFSLLGPVFAVFRPIAAFVSGVIGGFIVDKIDDSTPDLKGISDAATCREEDCCLKKTNQSKLIKVLRHGFVVLPHEIGGALIVGLIVAGFIEVLLPDSFFAGLLGTGFMAMLVMMLLGIPLYVCATASIPVAAAMMMKGITPGAALVFLMTGPATNAATIATIWRVMGRRTALLYLGVVAGTSLCSGLVLDWFFKDIGVKAVGMEAWMLPQWIKTISAIVLMVILGSGFLKKRNGKTKNALA